MTSRQVWKERLRGDIGGLRGHLLAQSRAIHADPEVGFQEVRASERLCSALQAAGYHVERGAGDLPTAFVAELRGEGGEGPTIAILAEYDALPDVGHGCGHNVIATSALGAGLLLARGPRDFAGRVLVIGTPAEEGGGGKILLAERGIFDGVDAAMMMHPSSYYMVRRGSLASSRVDVMFHGKAAHAAGSPDGGINALDAVIQTFVGINARRLQMRADARVHGIITHGGDAVNIIPSHAVAKFSVRARDRAYQRELVEMLRGAAQGAACATGARLEWLETRGYDTMVASPTLSTLCEQNMQALGLDVRQPSPNERMGSTDMGDISQVMPAIHAYFAISDEGTSGHSLEFAQAAASPRGDQAVLDAALSLAMTAADLLAEPNLVGRARAEHRAMQERGQVAGWEMWRAHGARYATQEIPSS